VRGGRDGVRDPGGGGAGNSPIVPARGRIGGSLLGFFGNRPSLQASLQGAKKPGHFVLRADARSGKPAR
jgi:hypothetical protein